MNNKKTLMEKINDIPTESLNKSIFKEAFLYESPSGIGPVDYYNNLRYDIQELINLGEYPIINLNNGLKKIELQTYVYYWIENSDDEILIAVEISKRQLGNIIHLLGKNPKYKGTTPFANTFYEDILQDVKGNLIFSDNIMTQSGYSVWRKLFLDGHKISVYDETSPGKVFIRLKDLSEFDSYFKMKDKDREKYRYRYVITESSSKNSYGDLITAFSLRRIKELVGVEY